MKSVSTTFVAFSFANNLFPIYSSLAVKTPENMKKVSSYSIGIVLVIYTFLSIVALFLFGSSIDLDTNVLKNVNFEIQIHKERWECNVLQILFLIVLAAHIPFIFFSGKEGLMIIIDEIDRRSVSKTLDERVKFLNSLNNEHNPKLSDLIENVRSSEKSLNDSRSIEPSLMMR